MLYSLNNAVKGVLHKILQDKEETHKLQEFIYYSYKNNLHRHDLVDTLDCISPTYDPSFKYEYNSTLKYDQRYYGKVNKGLFTEIGIFIYKGLIKIVDFKTSDSVFVPYLPLSTKSFKTSLILGFYQLSNIVLKRNYSTGIHGKIRMKEHYNICHKLYVRAYNYMSECINHVVIHQDYEPDDPYGIYFGPTGVEHVHYYKDFINLCNFYND